MSKKKNDVFVYMVLVSAVLLVKVLGLVRGMLLSARYGTGVEASAFTAVSNLPLIIFDVTFGTAITSAFVPVFNEKLASNGKSSANKFASNFFNIILAFSFLIVLIVLIFPDKAVLLVASGFKNSNVAEPMVQIVKNSLSIAAPGFVSTTASAMDIAVPLMRFIAPIIVFACCTYIFIGVLQSFGEFIVPALVSLLSNVAMVVYLLFFNSKFGINGLAIAFCIGWSLQFLFLLPFLKKRGFKYSFVFNLKSPDIKKVVILTLPLFVAALAQPINQLISSNFSSSVSDNGIATVNYAYNAYLIVAGVFSYALTNMFFPKMSRKFAENDTEGATAICKDMLSSITSIILPIMVFVGVCSKPIISLLYERGEFTSQDTTQVAVLLSIYAIAMISLSWQDIFSKYFYSMQKSFVPMISAFVGIFVNVVLSFILTPRIGLVGLAIATVVSGFLMTFVLALFSLKYSKKIFTSDFFAELLKLLIGAIGAFVTCATMLNIFSFDTSLVMRVIYILAILVTTLIVYVLLLLVLKSKNISSLKSVLKRREE